MKGNLRHILASHPTFDDALIQKTLISPRKGVHHLLYDEALELMEAIAEEFSEIVEPLESIGKTYEGRDILMIKVDAHAELKNTIPDSQEEEERKALEEANGALEEQVRQSKQKRDASGPLEPDERSQFIKAQEKIAEMQQ